MTGCRRVLVVDDEAIVRDIIGDILTLEAPDVEVVAVGTAGEAVRAVQARDFGLIFLDVCIQDGDGVQVLRTIKELRPDSNVYMMTGYEVEDRVQAAIEAGARGVIYKPFPVEQILDAVRGHGPVS